MAKVAAIECDLKSCGKLASPAEGAEIPEGWFLVDVFQQGDGNLEGRVLCSWACVSRWANDRIVATPKRKRRTREQMQADALANRAGVA